jgi:hypothetical protein
VLNGQDEISAILMDLLIYSLCVLVPTKSLRTPQNVINVACISNLVKSIQAFGKCKSHRFLASANFEEKKSNYFWLTINGTFSGSVWRLLAGTSTVIVVHCYLWWCVGISNKK